MKKFTLQKTLQNLILKKETTNIPISLTHKVEPTQNYQTRKTPQPGKAV